MLSRQDLSLCVKEGMYLEHSVHRHESPVLDQLPVVLPNLCGPSASPGVYAVSKPPTWPVHPCGQYQHNSLLPSLREGQFGLPSTIQRESSLLEMLRIYQTHERHSDVHRLDRMTSGVVVLSGNQLATASLFKEMRERTVEKYYVALVEGKLGTIGSVQPH